LLAAVNYLVLKNPASRFADLYAAAVPVGDAFEVFRAFVSEHEPEVRELVRTRHVQTNEVNRCSALLPGLQVTEAAMGGRPLALIDVGSSAGLQLLFDQYRYVYSNGLTAGPEESSVGIRAEVVSRAGKTLPLRPEMPKIASRVGLDMAPVDVMDDDACLWLLALVWPEEKDRSGRLEAALTIAREQQPVVLKGDAITDLPRLVQEASADVVPVIHHSHVLTHMPPHVRAAFETAVVPGLGATRDVAWLACEGSTMVLTTWLGGVREETLLAQRDPHGAWIEWIA
jgi:hypothetical protein